ncbi:MAG TPA: DNA recombination protein RmuC, partial [Rhabdochlamydiaceae bacterium]|nr:DNA recombination protein RmuC [Rhabdochlamydiaceae bacterium]
MVFILFFIIALLLATTILFLKRINQNLQKDLNRLNDSLQASNASIQKLQIQESKSAALADERQQVILSNTAVIDSLNKEKTQLTADKATLAKLLETKETSLQQINTQHLNDLEETKKAFATEFELLSNKLLKASSKEFAENSKAKIDELISPLKTRIETFQSNILNMQKDTISERLTLKANIKSIAESNSLLANQTDRLTKALRGDVQRQGAWGELILETVLESSGLRKGFEYNVHGIGIELQNS